MQKWWSLFFGAVLLAAFLLHALAPLAGWWLPPLDNKETFGADVDKLFYIILIITGFFFVLTEALLVYAMWRFSAKPGGRSVYVHGNHKLEVAWTIVPAAILLFIAFAQISTWAQIKYQAKMKPPQHVIAVSARQFEWRVRYPTDEKLRADMTVEKDADQWPEGVKKKADAWGSDTLADYDDLHVVNEVHTWAGANTRVYLTTRDVLHSFFLPTMRLKQDAVPGKIIPVWFKPDTGAANGEFKDGAWVYYKDEKGNDKIRELACAELCGWGHYKMQGHLYVHKDKKSYDAWLRYALARQRTTQREESK